MEKSSPTVAHLYGIDPGSGKAWAVFHCCFDLDSHQVIQGPSFHRWERGSLENSIRRLLEQAEDDSTTVLLAIDVPIITPHEFEPSYVSSNSRHYPFNVEPFTIRPCECALRSRPSVIDASLATLPLTELIGALCNWVRPFKSSSNTPFQRMASCEGVSVMIFSEAPHQPLMRVFHDALIAHKPDSVTISKTPLNPSSLESSHLYLLESHPAVSMGFWLMDGCFDEALTNVPRYKGSLKGEDYEDMTADEKSETIQTNLTDLAENVAALAQESHGIDAANSISNDDRLDAFVGLMNLLDLVGGRGDWFGTAASGYFLVPRLAKLEGKCFSDAWQRAEDIVRETSGRTFASD